MTAAILDVLRRAGGDRISQKTRVDEVSARAAFLAEREIQAGLSLRTGRSKRALDKPRVGIISESSREARQNQRQKGGKKDDHSCGCLDRSSWSRDGRDDAGRRCPRTEPRFGSCNARRALGARYGCRGICWPRGTLAGGRALASSAPRGRQASSASRVEGRLARRTDLLSKPPGVTHVRVAVRASARARPDAGPAIRAMRHSGDPSQKPVARRPGPSPDDSYECRKTDVGPSAQPAPLAAHPWRNARAGRRGRSNHSRARSFALDGGGLCDERTPQSTTPPGAPLAVEWRPFVAAAHGGVPRTDDAGTGRAG